MKKPYTKPELVELDGPPLGPASKLPRVVYLGGGKRCAVFRLVLVQDEEDGRDGIVCEWRGVDAMGAERWSRSDGSTAKLAEVLAYEEALIAAARR